ncbi:hypothetical protein HYDPIDRAFT_166852 [Hydnomerulius pinastri MD-312]|nr:hypothetical protein HYDPIDRAFT_166852 [Hydnomerulius pinastri MD-312]
MAHYAPPYPTSPQPSRQRASRAPAGTDDAQASAAFFTNAQALTNIPRLRAHSHQQIRDHARSNPAKALSLSFAIAVAATEWYLNQTHKTQEAYDKYLGQLEFSGNATPSPPLARTFVIPANGRPLTRQEFEQFKDPINVYGKIFKVDELLFKVVSIAELPRGPEIKLWYEITEEPVEVTPEQLQDMLSRTDCLYYPGN